MAERVIRIAIDSAPAEAGAHRIVRSLEEIGRKSREAAAEISKVESALLRLQRARGSIERARLETLIHARHLDRTRSGAVQAAGFQNANFIPGGAGLANEFKGAPRSDPALRQAAAVASGPIAKGLAELLFAIVVELIAEEVSQQIRASQEAEAVTSGAVQARTSAEQLAELSKQLEKVQDDIRRLSEAEIVARGALLDAARREADLLAQIKPIEEIVNEERTTARENAFFGPAVQPLEGSAVVVNLLKESLPDMRETLIEILRLMRDLHDRAFSEPSAAPIKEINGTIGASDVLQPAAFALPSQQWPYDGAAGCFGANGTGSLREHNLALEESLLLFARLEPEIEAAATAQDALNRGLEQGTLNGRELDEGARRAFADYADAATNAGAQIEQAIGGALGGLENALVGFVQTGKLEWKSLIDSMIADLIRLFIRSQILGPLAQGLGGLFAGGGGGLVGSYPGATYTAQGAAFESGRQLAFARGGVVGRPTLFPLARGIGLMGEAGPEAILPLKRLPGGDLGVRATGGGAVFNQTIVNEAGVEIETEERPNPSGGIDQLLVLVRRDAEQQMAEGTLGRVTAQRFGLSDRPIGR